MSLEGITVVWESFERGLFGPLLLTCVWCFFHFFVDFEQEPQHEIPGFL